MIQQRGANIPTVRMIHQVKVSKGVKGALIFGAMAIWALNKSLDKQDRKIKKLEERVAELENMHEPTEVVVTDLEDEFLS